MQLVRRTYFGIKLLFTSAITNGLIATDGEHFQRLLAEAYYCLEWV